MRITFVVRSLAIGGAERQIVATSKLLSEKGHDVQLIVLSQDLSMAEPLLGTAVRIVVIEKAIMQANLGLNPQNDGVIIMIAVPPLTEERRLGLVKQVKHEAESSKISIRNIRKDSIEKIKRLQKDGLSEDLAKDGESDIQKLVDSYIKKVDELVVEKEKDIMTI